MELDEKVKTNTWDGVDDFIAVFESMRAGNWKWYANTRCKYVALRRNRPAPAVRRH